MLSLNVKLDKGAYMPERAHKADAGWDLRVPNNHAEYFIPVEDAVIIDTGVHIQIPEGYVGFLKSKSGLNVRDGIVSEGVIDSGYTGSIIVKLYNHSNKVMSFLPGDKITQIVILPIAEVDSMVQVDEFKVTERGDNGFGSSGR